MPLGSSLRRVAFPLLGLLFLALLPHAHAPGRSAEGALRRRFPAQAARVLAAGSALRADSASLSASGLRAHHPRRGDGALVFALDDGFEVRVREAGAFGEGALAGQAVAYPRAGGTSYWAADEHGYEEWLLLSPGAVRADAPAAVWAVEGARVRQQGDVVALCDARGEARIEVTAPEAYAALGRPVATRLVARASRSQIELWVDAEGEEVLVDPGWSIARDKKMTAKRRNHTATLLADGTVLVTGGYDETKAVLRTAEIYDPTTRRWSATAEMTSPRAAHTAVRLDDGRVLVVGGETEFDGMRTIFNDSEIYDPSEQTWESAPFTGYFYLSGAATLLDDGRVFLLGGFDRTGDRAVRAEIFDPRRDIWTPTPPMASVHGFVPIAKLNDGRVFVASDFGSSLTSEIYDPMRDTWTTMTPAPNAMALMSMMALDSGEVLVFGGVAGNVPVAQSMTFELPGPTVPAPGRWKSSEGELAITRAGHAGAKLGATGRVLVTGGFARGDAGATIENLRNPIGAAEFYDLFLHRWRSAGSMSVPRASHTATSLADGSVLVAGGVTDDAFTPTDTAELFEPPNDAWEQVPEMATLRVEHTATRLADGSVLVAGGSSIERNGDRTLRTTDAVEIYSPSERTWETAAPMVTARHLHTATRLADDRVLVTGGLGPDGLPLSEVEIYDPVARRWSVTEGLLFARSGHTAQRLPDGRVLVLGGATANVPVTTTERSEVYDPVQGRWADAPSMRLARFLHTATRLSDDTVVVIGGSSKGYDDLAPIERYDPFVDRWTPAPPGSVGRYRHGASELSNGMLLVAGGIGIFFPGTMTEVFDPKEGAWRRAGSMHDARWNFTLTPVRKSGVLAAGGAASLETAEIYDPAQRDWAGVDPMHLGRVGHTATPLDGDPAEIGDVLVVGGLRSVEFQPSRPTDTAEVFHISAPGTACLLAAECSTGFCVDGVCCDTACNAGLCDACAVAAGADRDGECMPLVTTCGAYRCDPNSGGCRTECRSVDDCAAGNDCDPALQCVAPLVNASTRQFGQCAAAPVAPDGPPARAPAEPALLLLAVAAGMGRRSAKRR